MPFKKLVRCEIGGKPSFGNLLEVVHDGYLIQKLEGDIENGFTPSSEIPVAVSTLLCPLESTPFIVCIGVNYRGHVEELKIKDFPKHPVSFIKPPTTLAGPFDDIHIHKELQSQLDFEGEFTVIMGRDAKNISEENALDYVLGYTMGNDVSARNMQEKEFSGGLPNYAKSFDSFGPIGPVIISADLVPDPHALHYVVRVNGKVRQDIQTKDMVWSVKQIVAHLSRGTTLKAGTAIMTGTDTGVAWADGKYLRDGDVVEIEMDGLGKMANRMVFD